MKILTVMLLILMTALVSSAQTSYKGLTPGKSRKLEVERVLGQPVKQLSETLVEYRPQPLAGRVYVQYRAASGVVERIEFICRLSDSNCNDFMRSLNLQLPESGDAISPTDDKGRYLAFSASPHYVVETIDEASEKENDLLVPVRVAFYSRELYEAEVARAKKASETGTATTKEQSTSTNHDGIAAIIGAITDGDVLNGRALSLPPPAYPAIARAAHASGTVTVQVVIDEEGNVISARAISGHPLLQSASVAAARQAKFAPNPVKVSGVINYKFDEIIDSKTRDGGKNPPALSGGYGEVTGIVKLRAADGSLQPVANATVHFYRADLPNRVQTKTDSHGIFQYVGLLQTATWIVVVSGPGLKWAHLDGVRTPVAGLEIIAEPGDGSVPTFSDVENAVKKN